MPRDSATDVRLTAEGRRYYSSQTAPAAPATDARYRRSQPRIRASIVARKIATAIDTVCLISTHAGQALSGPGFKIF
jgi:hypothetical protein